MDLHLAFFISNKYSTEGYLLCITLFKYCFVLPLLDRKLHSIELERNFCFCRDKRELIPLNYISDSNYFWLNFFQFLFEKNSIKVSQHLLAYNLWIRKTSKNQMIKHSFFVRNSTCFFVIFSSFIRFQKCANDKREKKIYFKRESIHFHEKKSRIQKEKVSYELRQSTCWLSKEPKRDEANQFEQWRLNSSKTLIASIFSLIPFMIKCFYLLCICEP